MADNSVFITGVADGAFTSALSDLPPWATEATAFKIQGILEKTLNLQTKAFSDLIKKLTAGGAGNPLSPADAKKANDELDKFIRGLKRANDEQPKEKKRRKEQEDQQNKDKKWWKDEAGGRLLVLSGLTKFSLAIRQAFIDSADTFDQLYRSGINVMSGFDEAANGFEALQQIAALTGVRYTELAKTLIKYNTAVNAFGLGRFTKTMSAASKDLTQFGYTTKETADLLGSYLETQKGYADVRGKTDEQVQKDLVKFGERITKLSQATGILRTKLLEDIEAISQSVEANILAGQIGNDAAQSTLEFVASFKDKNLGQAFLRMMSDAIKPLNETFMDFQKTGFGGFGQELMNFTQSLEGLDPEEAAKRTAEFARAHSQEMAMMVQRGNLLRQAGVKEADGMLKVVTGLQQQARAYKEVPLSEKKRADMTAKATADLKNAYERWNSQIQRLFALTIPMVDMFIKILEFGNDMVDKFANLVHSFEGWLNSFDVIQKNFGKIQILPWAGLALVIYSVYSGFSKLLKIFDIGKGTLKPIFNGLKSLGRFIAPIIESLGGLGGILRTIGSIFARFLGPLALLYSAFQLGTAIGEVIYENLSQFELFNDMMDGIFSGIEASWNWIIDTISNIGVALSNAGSWVVSKIKGVGEFFLNAGIWVYDKIKSAGTYIIDAFKNTFSSIASKVADMFPWIKTLSEYGFKLVDSVVSIHKSVVGFIETFGETLVDFVKRVFEKFIDKMIPGFAKSWFGKSEPASAPAGQAASAGPAAKPASAPTAQTASVNPAPKPENSTVSVIKNPKPSTLNSPSQVSAKPSAQGEQATAKEPSKPLGAGIEKPAPESSINTMLGYQNSLLEQLLLSTNSLVSTNKDILKYTRAHT